MSNKERWLSATALLVSIQPFILIAACMQLLPYKIQIPIWQPTSADETLIILPKYQYLYIAIMGFIPAGLVVLSRILRARRLVERNFMFMNLAALILGFVFLVVSVYGLLNNIIRYDVDLLMQFDFFGGTAVVTSLLVGMLANFLPSLRRNDMLGLKNRYTMADMRVWAKVHRVAGDVVMGTLFLFAMASSALSIVLDFRFGWVHIILWVVVMCALIVWSYLYSRHVSKTLRKENKDAAQIN